MFTDALSVVISETLGEGKAFPLLILVSPAGALSMRLAKEGLRREEKKTLG